MKTYLEVKNMKKKLLKERKELLHKVKDFKKISEEFYDLLRWEELDCTDEEYSELYNGFMYELENFDGFEIMDRMIKFLKILKP